MRKIVESTFVSLDGVVESPAQWTGPHWDQELKGHALAQLDRYDTFLFGRVTYDLFRASWPSLGSDPYFDRINRMPKLVATRTLRDTAWNATPLTGDLVEELRKVKWQRGKDIIKYGTGQLDKTLLEHGLIDELHISIFPVVVGKGARLFEGFGIAPRFQLAATKAFHNGVVQLTYVPHAAPEA